MPQRNETYGEKKMFAPGSLNATPEESIRWSRCHSVGKNIQKEYDYASLAEKQPKSKLRELIDWEEIEACGLTRPLDFPIGV
jgi:hypothetical protein